MTVRTADVLAGLMMVASTAAGADQPASSTIDQFVSDLAAGRRADALAQIGYVEIWVRSSPQDRDPARIVALIANCKPNELRERTYGSATREFEWQCKDGPYRAVLDPDWRKPKISVVNFRTPRDLGEARSRKLLPVVPAPPTPYNPKGLVTDPRTAISTTLLESVGESILQRSDQKLRVMLDPAVEVRVDQAVIAGGQRKTIASGLGPDQAIAEFGKTVRLLGAASYKRCYLLGSLGVCQFEYPNYDRKLIVDFSVYDDKVMRLRFDFAIENKP